MKNSRLLERYIDYLISSPGATTAVGLSTLLEGELSHDKITRFLAVQPKPQLNEVRLKNDVV